MQYTEILLLVLGVFSLLLAAGLGFRKLTYEKIECKAHPELFWVICFIFLGKYFAIGVVKQGGTWRLHLALWFWWFEVKKADVTEVKKSRGNRGIMGAADAIGLMLGKVIVEILHKIFNPTIIRWALMVVGLLVLVLVIGLLVLVLVM